MDCRSGSTSTEARGHLQVVVALTLNKNAFTGNDPPPGGPITSAG